jgi:hypothetical protein
MTRPPRPRPAKAAGIAARLGFQPLADGAETTQQAEPRTAASR